MIYFCISKYIINSQVVDAFGNKIPKSKQKSTKYIDAKYNNKDKLGRKQGPWKKQFPNGVIAYEGTFKDDKPIGILKKYHQNGTRAAIINFETEDFAAVQLFNKDNKLVAKGYYLNMKKDSLWTYFSKDGRTIGHDNYKNGLLNGISIQFSSNGKPAVKTHYKNGRKSGLRIKYFKNGKIQSKENYLNGILHGKFETFYNDGVRKIQGQYINGYQEGTWIMYTSGGGFDFKIDYQKGIPLNNEALDKKQREFFRNWEKDNSLKEPEKYLDKPYEYFK